MSILRSLNTFRKYLKAEGVRCVPWVVRNRWNTKVERVSVRRDVAARAREAEGYQAWLKSQQPDEAEQARQRQTVFSHRLSFLIPTYNTEPVLLHALADSLLVQTAEGWEACFYDGCSTREDTRQALKALTARDARLRVVFGEENLGIAGNTNKALDMARYDWVALVDHDDLLTVDAAFCVLQCAEEGADLFYSDEDKCDEAGTRFFDPHMKSDFSPDALRAGNYICHLMAMEKALMLRIGGLHTGFDGSQDHDLALRCTEAARHIVHLPRILYHWRQVGTSFSHQKAEACVNSAVRAVNAQFDRLHMDAQARNENLSIRVDVPHMPPCDVSLIVDAQHTDCTASLLRLLRESDIQPMEVILLRPVPAMAEKAKGLGWHVMTAQKRTEGLNAAARQAKGTMLMFLDGTLRMRYTTWLHELMIFAHRGDVGCVGGRIINRRGRYLHAGYAVDVPGGALSHQRGVSMYDAPYMLTDRRVRNVTAVTAALMMVRKGVFDMAGGFDPYDSDLTAAAFGLKCRALGLLNVFTPEVLAMDMGSPQCLTDAAPAREVATFRAQFGEHPTEAYYSPLMEKCNGNMVLDTTRQAPKV